MSLGHTEIGTMNLCNHPHHVRWNPHNGVVQCHKCGHVWVPLDAQEGEPYRRMIEAEQARLQVADQDTECKEWLHPADYRKDAETLNAAKVSRPIMNNPCNGCQRSGSNCHVCEHGGP